VKFNFTPSKKLLAILGVVALGILVFMAVPAGKYEEIDLKPVVKEDDRDFPGWDIFSSINDSEGNYIGKGKSLGDITPQTPALIKLKFKEPENLSGFSLFFFGNLDSISSAMPQDFRVAYYNPDGEKIFLKEVKNHSSPVYRFFSKKELHATGIEILITRAVFVDNQGKGTVLYRDFKFYTKRSVPLMTGIIDFISQNNRKLLAFWAYYLIYFFFLFIPGYVGQSLLKKKWKVNLGAEEAVVFSPLLTLILIPISVSLYLLSGFTILLYLYAFVFFISLVIFIRAKLYQDFFANKILLLVMAVSLFVVSLTIAQREYLFNLPFARMELDQISPPTILGYSGYHADSMLPWRIGQIFLHRLDLGSPRAKELLMGTIFDRTPVLPMLTSVIMKYFSESHFVYQRFLETLTALYYGTFFVLIKKYFSKKIAVITLLLMWTNVQLSLMSFNVELYYKYFAIYPVLLAITLIIKNKENRSLAVGLLTGLAFLIHPFTLIPSSSIIIFYFTRNRFDRKFIRQPTVVIATLALLCAGWFLIPKLTGLSNNAVRGKSLYFIRASKFEGNMLINKAVNFVNLFIPNSPLKKVGAEGKLSITSPEYKHEFLRFSLISNLTPVLFILLVVYLVKNRAKDYPAIIFGLAPVFTFWLLYLQEYNQSYSFGGSYFLLYPFSLPFLFSYLVSNLAKESRVRRLVIYSSYVLFMFFILYYVSWVFNKMSPTSLTTKGIFWLIVATFFSLSAYIVKYASSNKE